MHILIVLSAVDLVHQVQFVAGEIREKWTDRGLATKMRTIQRKASKELPKLAFGVGHVAAESASARDSFVTLTRFALRCHSRAPPPPTPPHHASRGGRGAQRRAPLTQFCRFVPPL